MIIKRRRTKHFAVVPNEVLEDRRLSAEARGVLAYLLSRPNDWETRLQQLRAEFGCGKGRIERIMREIIEAGYAERERARSDDGSFAGYDYTITDDPAAAPQAENPPTVDQPWVEKPWAENPSAENPPTDLIRTPTKNGVLPNERETRGRASEAEPLPDADLLADLRRQAPTTAHDSIAETDAAWLGLSHTERVEAVARYGEWLAQKPSARSAIAGLPTYLREKRWLHLKAAGAAALPPEERPRAPAFGRAWWWLFLRAVAAATNSGEIAEVRRRASAAASFGGGWPVAIGTLPAIEAAASRALAQRPVDGADVREWRAWCRERGIDMPLPDKVGWVFLPPTGPPQPGAMFPGLEGAAAMAEEIGR